MIGYYFFRKSKGQKINCNILVHLQKIYNFANEYLKTKTIILTNYYIDEDHYFDVTIILTKPLFW